MIDYRTKAEGILHGLAIEPNEAMIEYVAARLYEIAKQQIAIDAKIAENLEITSIYEAWDFQQQCADAIRTQPTYIQRGEL